MAWAKRYSSITLEEMGDMTRQELACYCDSLAEIIKKENKVD